MLHYTAFMKKNLFLFTSLLFLLFIFSCQTAKKAEDAEESQSEKLAQQAEQHQQDSLQNSFCECLIKDSINSETRLNTIDVFISQKIDINIPCRFEEEKISNSAETAFVNMGVAISNRFLHTNFRKRNSKVNTVTKNYPILMLFSEDTFMIRQLVQRGANLDTKTKDIASLPDYYVSQNKLEYVKFVLKLGAKTEEINISSNNEKMLDFLIEKGAKTSSIDKIILFKEENYKKLAEKYKIDLSKITCEEFDKISKVTQFQKINFERTKWLLENNISPSCINGAFLVDIIEENFDGRIYSSQNKQKSNQHTRKEWIELLEKYTINWNQCASFGKNPLMFAVEKQDIELIKILLNQKANPNFACSFAGKQKTAKNILEETIKYAENNEMHKKEEEKDKYTKKDAEKHTTYINKLIEIKVLLE